MVGPAVLIVEDDPLTSEMLAEALEEAGLVSTRAEDHDEALRRVAEHAETLKVLVADFDLGAGPSGLETAVQARRHVPRLVVICVTGRSVAAVEEMGDGFIVVPKPYLPEQLSALVASHVHYP